MCGQQPIGCARYTMGSIQFPTRAGTANAVSEDASRERERTREELISLLQAPPRLHSEGG